MDWNRFGFDYRLDMRVRKLRSLLVQIEGYGRPTLTLRPGPRGVSAPLVDGPWPREFHGVEIDR